MNDETAMVKWRIIRPIMQVRPMGTTGELLKELRGEISKSYLNDVLNWAKEKGFIARPRKGLYIHTERAEPLQQQHGNWLVQLLRDMHTRKEQKLESMDNNIRGLLRSIYHSVPQSYLDAHDFKDVEELIQWFMNELPARQRKTQ